MNPNEMSFDEEEDLNTPVKDDDIDTTPMVDMDYDDEQLQNIMAQYGDMLEEMDLDGSHFNIWGTAHDEREAFKYINGSIAAKMCIHVYRCCPLYKMKFMFCIKVSCELCHVLCIFEYIFLFFDCGICHCESNPFVCDGRIYATIYYTNV